MEGASKACFIGTCTCDLSKSCNYLQNFPLELGWKTRNLRSRMHEGFPTEVNHMLWGNLSWLPQKGSHKSEVLSPKGEREGDGPSPEAQGLRC